MRKHLYQILVFLPLIVLGEQYDTYDLSLVQNNYTKVEYQIPMRDGVKLFTIVYIPKDSSKSYGVLYNITPYGIGPYGQNELKPRLGPNLDYTKQGFIFVYQDVRGSYMSEGKFKPLVPLNQDTNQISKDVFDSLEWLKSRLKSKYNGKTLLWGVSYGAYCSLISAMNGHQDIKGSLATAPFSNWGKDDDFYHNGTFYLSHAFSFFVALG